MTIPDELHPEYDLDYSKGPPNRYAGQIDWSQGMILPDNDPAPVAGSILALDERDEYPKVTQADLDRAKFRVGLKPAPAQAPRDDPA